MTILLEPNGITSLSLSVGQFDTVRRLSAKADVRVCDESPESPLKVYVGTCGEEPIRHWLDESGAITLTEADEYNNGDWLPVDLDIFEDGTVTVMITGEPGKTMGDGTETPENFLSILEKFTAQMKAGGLDDLYNESFVEPAEGGLVVACYVANVSFNNAP